MSAEDVPPARAAFVNGALAFTAGFSDAVGFVALAGLFTAHVTGNFILLGAEAAGLTQGGATSKLLAFPVFVAGVAGTHLAVRRLEAAGRPRLRPLLLAQAVFMALFMALGLLASPVADPEAALPVLAGMAGVLAMAIQNAKARLVLATHVPTTIMTGNTTQAVLDAVELARGSGPGREAALGRLRRMVPAILCFAAGAVLGALGYAAVGFLALLLPLAALGALVATTPPAAS